MFRSVSVSNCARGLENAHSRNGRRTRCVAQTSAGGTPRPHTDGNLQRARKASCTRSVERRRRGHQDQGPGAEAAPDEEQLEAPLVATAAKVQKLSFPTGD